MDCPTRLLEADLNTVVPLLVLVQDHWCSHTESVATLNALSVAVVAFFGDMALHGNQPGNSLRLLFIVANPLVINFLFRPKGKARWLMPTSLASAVAGTLALFYELVSHRAICPSGRASTGSFLTKRATSVASAPSMYSLSAECCWCSCCS